MKEIAYTNSSTSKVLNEKTGNYLDIDLELIQADIEDLTTRINRFSYFNRLDELNLEGGQETIVDIVMALPEYSIFNFHKTSDNGNTSIYPNASGLLTVVKGSNANRVKFEFNRVENTWIGFYDEANGNKRWSGWKKMITDTHTIDTYDITDLDLLDECVIEDVVDKLPSRTHLYCTFSSSSRYKNLLAQLPQESGILHIFKSSAYRTVVEFFGSENGTENDLLNLRFWANYNADSKQLSNWGCVWHGFGSILNRPLREKCYVGMEYFDTDLNKPIWWNGSKWVDSNGFDV